MAIAPPCMLSSEKVATPFGKFANADTNLSLHRHWFKAPKSSVRSVICMIYQSQCVSVVLVQVVANIDIRASSTTPSSSLSSNKRSLAFTTLNIDNRSFQCCPGWGWCDSWKKITKGSFCGPPATEIELQRAPARLKPARETRRRLFTRGPSPPGLGLTSARANWVYMRKREKCFDILWPIYWLRIEAWYSLGMHRIQLGPTEPTWGPFWPTGSTGCCTGTCSFSEKKSLGPTWRARLSNSWCNE